eukprot:1209284-Pyramimonas_sp.AAC.1
MGSEVLKPVSLKNLICANIPVWRSASDIVLTSGYNVRIPVSSLVQLLGIKRNMDQCLHGRVGQ